MKTIKTWKQKSIELDNDIQDLIDYHKDNYSLSIIKERFNNKIKTEVK